MADEKNKKVPKSDAIWEYPFNQVTHTLGGHELFYNSTPDQESYRMRHPSGTYMEHTKDGHKVEVVANQRNTLTSNGETRVTEGTLDTSALGGIRDIVMGGHHAEIAMDFSRGIYGQVLHVAKNILTTYTDNEHHELSAQGKVASHNDGYCYNNTKEAKVCMTQNNRIIATMGEHQVYTEGNYDNYINQKGRIYSQQNFILQSNATMNVVSQSDTNMTSNAKFVVSSQSDMTLTSQAKYNVNAQSTIAISGQSDITITGQSSITLKVGGSTIKISSSGVDITSSGPINIKGSQTNLQGGGMPAPPTTIN